jgi:uncharacterized protein YdaU (DUF1376 family)
MAGDFPAMPLWIDSFTADAAQMSTTEAGAYILLLVAMWRAGGVLPNDDKRLAKYVKLTPDKWRRVRPTMLEFFRVEGDFLTHNRLLKSLKSVHTRSQRASRAAQAKWLKMKGPSDALALRPHSHRNAGGMLIKTREESPSPTVGNAHEEEGDQPAPHDASSPVEITERLRSSRLIKIG